jgi:hypothetical protein
MMDTIIVIILVAYLLFGGFGFFALIAWLDGQKEIEKHLFDYSLRIRSDKEDILRIIKKKKPYDYDFEDIVNIDTQFEKKMEIRKGDNFDLENKYLYLSSERENIHRSSLLVSKYANTAAIALVVLYLTFLWKLFSAYES